LFAAPFCFPQRYRGALELVRKNVRTFATTSVGRLFDAAASLLGFTREITFEGQAAMWLEQLARQAPFAEAYPFPFDGNELDFRPLLKAVVDDRVRGRDIMEIARAFQRGIAQGLADAVLEISRGQKLGASANYGRGAADAVVRPAIVLSGGVFQNELLLEDLKSLLARESLEVWTNHAVPPNDGGISLGQAALAAFGRFNGVPRIYRHALAERNGAEHA
jgi:hydrogenase maturation protein HypF